MLHSHRVTKEQYEDMMADCFSLIAGYSEIEGAEEVDWRAQAMKLLPDGMDSAGNYLYAFEDEENATVGYVWACDKEDGMRLVAYIGVKEAYRKRGYAAFMLKTACEDAKQAGEDVMGLGVEKNNTLAIHLYEKLDFKIVAEEDIRYIMLKQL